MGDMDEFLEHYGVKGMRWGVSRNLKKLRTSGERQAFLDSKDQKWLDKVKADPKVGRVAKRATNRMKREVYPRLNKEFEGVNLNRDAYAKSQYEAKAKSAMITLLDQESYKAHKWSPTRTREVVFESQTDGTLKARIVTRDNMKLTNQRASIAKSDRRRDRADARTAAREASAQHADVEVFGPDDDPYEGLVFSVILDDLGHFVDTETPFDDELEQSDIDMEDFLEHYGVKGMRWGVTKPSSVTTSSGGSNGGAAKRAGTPNANASSNATVKKAKKTYTDAELRDKVSRMRLEKDLKTIKAENKRLKNPEPKNARDLKDKRTFELSDAELRRRIDRIRMERELASLSDETSQRKMTLGQKIAQEVVANAARSVGTKVAINAFEYAGKNAFARSRNPKLNALGEALFAEKGKKNKGKD